jgi:hypothetical protein
MQPRDPVRRELALVLHTRQVFSFKRPIISIDGCVNGVVSALSLHYLHADHPAFAAYELVHRLTDDECRRALAQYEAYTESPTFLEDYERVFRRVDRARLKFYRKTPWPRRASFKMHLRKRAKATPMLGHGELLARMLAQRQVHTNPLFDSRAFVGVLDLACGPADGPDLCEEHTRLCAPWHEEEDEKDKCRGVWCYGCSVKVADDEQLLWRYFCDICQLGCCKTCLPNHRVLHVTR